MELVGELGGVGCEVDGVISGGNVSGQDALPTYFLLYMAVVRLY